MASSATIAYSPRVATPERYEVVVGDRVHMVEISPGQPGEGAKVVVDGEPCPLVDLGSPGEFMVSGGRDPDSGSIDRMHHVHVEGVEHGSPTTTGLRALVRGRTIAVQSEPARVAELRRALSGDDAGGSQSGGHVKAPMPGRIVKILVEEGALVEKGQALVIVEAMKMENELYAECAGQVTQISVQIDKAVDAGETLLILEAATPA